MAPKLVLVVEDSRMVMQVLRHMLARSSHLQPLYASSFAEAKILLENEEHEFFAALVDLSLPDAPEGEVVDATLVRNIPTVVLTGSFEEQRRNLLLSKGVVDYVTKEGRYSYEYALGVLERLIHNQHIKVLVVDDSATARKFVTGLLSLHLYQVIEAIDGVEAVKALVAHPDIKLLITDYHMPRMDGFELVKHIRVKYEKSNLVIIGLSSEGEGALSAKFIKNGANDFLRKPFNHEEFFCRITHHMEFIELIESVRDAAHRDELTGCFNRKYFVEQAGIARERALNNHCPLSIAVLSIDNYQFHKESHGIEMENFVLQRIARWLSNSFEKFILARAGEHEFLVLLPGLNNVRAVELIDKVRQILIANRILTDNDSTVVTFSGGVTSTLGSCVDDMLVTAQKCLHRATEAGGDLVFGDDEEHE